MFKTKGNRYMKLTEFLDTEVEDANVYFKLNVMNKANKPPSPEPSEDTEARDDGGQSREVTLSPKTERKNYLGEMSLIIGGILCLWLITTRKG